MDENFWATPNFIVAIIGSVIGIIALIISCRNHSESRHANLINLKLEYLHSISKVNQAINSSIMSLETASLNTKHVKNIIQRTEIRKHLAEALSKYESIKIKGEVAYEKINNLNMIKMNSRKRIMLLQEARVIVVENEKITFNYEKQALDIIKRLRELIEK